MVEKLLNRDPQIGLDLENFLHHHSCGVLDIFLIEESDLSL